MTPYASDPIIPSCGERIVLVYGGFQTTTWIAHGLDPVPLLRRRRPACPAGRWCPWHGVRRGFQRRAAGARPVAGCRQRHRAYGRGVHHGCVGWLPRAVWQCRLESLPSPGHSRGHWRDHRRMVPGQRSRRGPETLRVCLPADPRRGRAGARLGQGHFAPSRPPQGCPGLLRRAARRHRRWRLGADRHVHPPRPRRRGAGRRSGR